MEGNKEKAVNDKYHLMLKTLFALQFSIFCVRFSVCTMKPITNLSDATEESETRIAAHDRTLLLSPLCFIQFCLRKYAIRTTAKKENWTTPNKQKK